MAVDLETQSRVDYDEGDEASRAEETAVKKLWEEYETAFKFDAPARKQFAIDRAYASGKANPGWASDANLIGSFIDVLVAFLYARDPDMDTRPAARAGMQPDRDAHSFADTLSLVVPRLWKDARLKRAMQKACRGSLSVGPGWIKGLMLTKTGRDPQIERDLNDVQDNLQRIRATEQKLDGGEYADDEREQLEKDLQLQMEALQARVEVITRAGLALDYVRSDDIQVSLDVADSTDYLDADWIAHALFVPKDDLCKRFETLKEKDKKAACVYYQKQPYVEQASTDLVDKAKVGVEGTHDTGHFTKNQPAEQGGGSPVEFVKIVELWDKRDNHIKTMVEGVKRWAKEPYTPPFSTTRFYPFFQLALYPVDGERFPQSLSWRLRKLQDEYSNARSNYRRVRERTLPGTIFNAAAVSPAGIRKITESVAAEFVAVDLTDPTADLNKIFAPKPTASINHNLYDTHPILSDMERISGVQEALQSAVQTAKTATEAQIQQSGFASRTSAARDTLEDVLRELAIYTTELALQAVPYEQAVRIAGPLAFWPDGLDVEDVTTLVEVDIDAGSTGKPGNEKDRETWAMISPVVLNLIKEIRMAQMMDPEMAMALSEWLRETLKRLDDRLDVEKFVPMGQPPLPPMLPGGGGAPGAPGEAPPPSPDPGAPVEAPPPPEAPFIEPPQGL
jgi:hypothetical protein